MKEFNFRDFLDTHRSRIIEQWVRRLRTEVSEQYSNRPREELFGTISEAYEGYYQILVFDEYGHINRFIDKIARMRLEAGFPLSDVQKAFELYGDIVIPLLIQEPAIHTIESFYTHSCKVDRCLAYTIHCFSDRFQSMHQQRERLSAIGEAVAHVTHEIKNPLMLIGGFSNQVLTALDQQDEKIVRKLRTIIQEVERLETFLKDIGRFAKDILPNKKPFDVNQMIHQVVGLFDSQFKVQGIDIQLNLTTVCSGVVADPDQMEQVFLNLIKNAIEAMLEGGTLSIKSYDKPNKICIEIADTGCGISKENIERLTTPFFTTREQGTGLGLCICQKIVTAHRGTLTIFSEGQGKGALAALEIPASC